MKVFKAVSLVLCLNLALLFAGGAVQTAMACECKSMTSQERMEKADIVFMGLTRGKLYFMDGFYRQAVEVIMMENNNTKTSVHEGAQLMIEQGHNDCAIEFVTDRYYMVYAQLLDDGSFITDKCIGTYRIHLKSDPYR